MARSAPTTDTGTPHDGSPVRECSTRYEDDLHTLVQEQIAMLRAGDLAALDIQNIAEEFGDVGRAQDNQLESAPWVLLMPVLNWDRQPEHRTPDGFPATVLTAGTISSSVLSNSIR